MLVSLMMNYLGGYVAEGDQLAFKAKAEEVVSAWVNLSRAMAEIDEIELRRERQREPVNSRAG